MWSGLCSHSQLSAVCGSFVCYVVRHEEDISFVCYDGWNYDIKCRIISGSLFMI